MSAPILPGATLGMFGGGQLGRMFALAALRMGYRVSVFAPEESHPCGEVASRVQRADYDDLDAVRAFAQTCDVLTIEFENIPSATLEAAAEWAPVRPAGALLHTTQNRAREKQTLRSLGIPVAPFHLVESAEDLGAIAQEARFPGVLKSCAWGYDGKGQRRVESAADLEAAFSELGQRPTVLEEFIDFQCEISVVGARGLDGQVALFEPSLNHHRHHILDVSLSPAPLPEAVLSDACNMARQILTQLEVVGVLCIEFFVQRDGSLLVNELAPRPHNSGHLTIDAHACCQFEQQVRAICGLPLGSTERKVPAAAMANLLGDLWQGGEPNWAAALQDPGVHLHLYGKGQARAGRKMGHLVVTDSSVQGAERRVLAARDSLAAAKGVR